MKRLNSKLDFRLNTAVPWTPGYYPDPIDKHILNLSDYSLSTIEKQALCRGLSFCTPRNKPQPVIDAEFENLYKQLQGIPHNESDMPLLKSELVCMSKSFSQKRRFDSVLNSTHQEAIKYLRNNKDIIICPPDKGNAVIMMNRNDYVDKVQQILSNPSKFQKDDFQIDLTSKIEKQVCNHISKLRQCNLITNETAKSLTPTGSTFPKLYGLPKVHKPDVPVRPILSMVNTPTHKLAKWLVEILRPVRDAVSQNVVKDSFDFVNIIRSIDLTNTHMCSFDVQSLFTNIPLLETIDHIPDICNRFQLDLPMNFKLLKSLILLCTHKVQFSFNNIFYFQNDGVAMGSPLGPILADIFMGYVEHFLLHRSEHSPKYYFRYVDDTFAVFDNTTSALSYLDILNSLHSNLRFTIEHEDSGSLSFLDVNVHKTDRYPTTSVHRKSTWSGLYLHFHSFVPIRYKQNLVKTLFNRALKICSEDHLPSELSLLRATLKQNAYPPQFISAHFRTDLPRHDEYGPKKKPVFLQVPYLGESFTTLLRRRLRAAIGRSHPAAELRLLTTTSSINMGSLKDRVRPVQATNVVYKFLCNCGSSYLGRTQRTLSQRIDEHFPRWLTQGDGARPRSSAPPSSAVTRHVLQCPTFDRTCPAESKFKVVCRARRPWLLPFLEMTQILRHKPDLCVQKHTLVTLALPWT